MWHELSGARSAYEMLPTHDRRSCNVWDVSMQNKEGVKGRYWFMDADVKDGTLTGKTGKTILTVLRHLSRLHEVLHCHQHQKEFEFVVPS